MSSSKRSQARYVKQVYRLRIGPQYERGLRNRGSLTVGLEVIDSKLNHWKAPKEPLRNKLSRQAIVDERIDRLV